MQTYVLERWTINAKSREVHGICVQLGPLETETVPTAYVLKHCLMRHFYIVAEIGSLSLKKYEHACKGIETIQKELALMNDEQDEEDGGSPEEDPGQSPIVSNFSLQDPPIIVSKGRPKSLQHMNPKENAPAKKRQCTIYKQEGHVRTKCPTHRSMGESSSNTIPPNPADVSTPFDMDMQFSQMDENEEYRAWMNFQFPDDH